MVKKNFLKSSLIVLAVLAVALIPTASVNASGVANKNVPALAYSAHVQSFGWMGTKNAGKAEGDSASIAGTEGLSKRVEALRVTFEAPEGVVLKYNAHIQGIGWTGWTEITENNQLIGTQGQQKRLEAIKFSVTGLEGYEIKYRAHVQTYGWQDWLTADSSEGLAKIAGTQGESKRIESIQFMVLDANEAELFNWRQEAIQNLKDSAVPGDYTMNSKLLAEELNNGIESLKNPSLTTKDAINSALTTAKNNIIAKVMKDETIRNKAKTLSTAIDDWLKGEEFDKAYKGATVKDVIIEVPVVKDAIATAKANLLKHDEYPMGSMEKTGAPTNANYYKEATDEIGTALAQYALDKVNELYNKKLTDKNDKIYTNNQWTTDRTTLKVTEEGEIDPKNLPTLSNIKGVLTNLAPSEYTLKNARDDKKTALRNYMQSTLHMDIGDSYQNGSKPLYDAGIISVILYDDIEYVKYPIDNILDEMDNAQNIPELISLDEEAHKIITAGLKTFVSNIVGLLTKPNNFGIMSDENVKVLRNLINDEKATDKQLRDTLNEVLAGMKK